MAVSVKLCSNLLHTLLHTPTCDPTQETKMLENISKLSIEKLWQLLAEYSQKCKELSAEIQRREN